MTTPGTPQRVSTFAAVASPPAASLAALPQRASSFAAFSAFSEASSSSLLPPPSASTSAVPALLLAAPRPTLTPRRHTMRPLRSSPLAGPSLALSADGVAVLGARAQEAEREYDADVSTVACGSGSGSSSGEHGPRGGNETVSAPALLKFPSPTEGWAEGRFGEGVGVGEGDEVGRDDDNSHKETEKEKEKGREKRKSTKLKKRVSSGFGLGKIKTSFGHAGGAAAPAVPAGPRSDTSHGHGESSHGHGRVSTEEGWASGSAEAVPLPGILKMPEPSRTRRRSALLPPPHSASHTGLSEAASPHGYPAGSRASLQAGYAGARSFSYQDGFPSSSSSSSINMRPHSRAMTDHARHSQHKEHWMTAVPNGSLTHLVKTMADPASPEATWLQVIAPPKFSREGIRQQGVVMPVRKAEATRRKSVGVGAVAVAAGAGARMEQSVQGPGVRGRSRSALVGSGAGYVRAGGSGHAQGQAVGDGKGKGKAREEDILEVHRDSGGVFSSPPRPNPDRADSRASVSSQGSSGQGASLAANASLSLSPGLVRAESPLATLGRRVSAEFARAQAQEGQSPQAGQEQTITVRSVHQEDSGSGDAHGLPQPSPPFASAPILSRASSASSLGSVASFRTAPDDPSTPDESLAPLAAPSPPFFESAHGGRDGRSEESLASTCSSPPELGGGARAGLTGDGTGTSVETPSLTRSRTVSTSGGSVGASVRIADAVGGGKEEVREKPTGVVEVRVNGVPVELVSIPSLSNKAQCEVDVNLKGVGKTKGRGTLKKKLKGSVVRVEMAKGEEDLNTLKKANADGPIKRALRRMFKGGGGR